MSATLVLRYSNTSNVKITSTFRVLAFSSVNDQGLGGSDDNNNGVRDAIEEAVTSHYSNSARQRSAAFQVLAAYRNGLLNQDTVEVAFTSVSRYFQSKQCMKNIMGAFTGNYDAYDQESRYLEHLMLDNGDRIRAWLQLSDKVAGQVFLDFQGESCTFDYTSLPN